MFKDSKCLNKILTLPLALISSEQVVQLWCSNPKSVPRAVASCSSLTVAGGNLIPTNLASLILLPHPLPVLVGDFIRDASIIGSHVIYGLVLILATQITPANKESTSMCSPSRRLS
jgi:hypothetical protein